jgi:hypothetical protein
MSSIAWLIAVAILAIFCAWWVAFRRLTGLQMQIDELRHDIRGLEAEYSGLLIRQLNKPRSRKARKLSGPSSETLEETAAPPVQLDEKNEEAAVPPVQLDKKNEEAAAPGQLDDKNSKGAEL